MTKHVYLFSEGNKGQKMLLGSKGANLAEMTSIGLPVPPGLIITTETCNEYNSNGKQFPAQLKSQVEEALKALEKLTGKGFGDAKNPLLVSVRSGAPVSMPGMMETVLNLGLNDETVKGLIELTGNRRFALDSYRRLISMFGDVVFDVGKDHFEEAIHARKEKKGVKLDTELNADDWEALITEFKQIFEKRAGRPFPQDPKEQLWAAIEAVFKSWNIPRAMTYRKHHGIPHDLGTAVNVQTMVFGNMGDDSATGVCFTRNPATGEKGIYGEYLINAQGEDVVAGIRTPEPISVMKEHNPEIYQELLNICDTLERHYKEMQDIEFTMERGKLYILQTRTGKRTAHAAIKIAVDLFEEGILTEQEALLSIDANQLPQTLLPSFDLEAKAKAKDRLLGKGLGASPGAATGKVVFNPDEAEQMAKAGESVILTRPETAPDDIHGMLVARGILTTRGGTTSHAAVVARGMGKPCVAGAESMKIDLAAETLTANGKVFRKGEIISLDGATGEVFEGAIPTKEPDLGGNMEILMGWADKYRVIGIRANADTPEDAERARKLGAKGIGLCRTEHMFMDAGRLPVMQEMIRAESEQERRKLLDKLLPMQHEDFKGIFRAMAGFPVTIRLLDPPLHEFLPNVEALIEEVTTLRIKTPGTNELQEKEALLKKVLQLKESNPMLGLRGCRLGLQFPEISEMQVRAIFEAATDIAAEGLEVEPEIMIPLVGTAEELRRLRELLENVAQEVMTRKGRTIPYLFGTMIEVPRAALTADEVAEFAEFFSFGTNDLTQMTWGYSRDDAEGKFLSHYLDTGVLKFNPFETLDSSGVGQLVELARDKGRSVRPTIKLGICGEHGGEARSVEFCHRAGLNYVSCSPFRVPVARVAGAQAAVRQAQEAGKNAKDRDLVSV